MGQRHRAYLDEVEDEFKGCDKPKTYDDKLAELEAVIRDYYVAQGYKLDGTWGFKINIETHYKEKELKVYFIHTKRGFSTERLIVPIFTTTRNTTKEMFEEAIKHFKQGAKDDT